MIELKGEELLTKLCQLAEPNPPQLTARQAREKYAADRCRNWEWYSCCAYHSPLGWWQAEIGSDHGPESQDDELIRWRPKLDYEFWWGTCPDFTYAVIDLMKSQGWLPHLSACFDGWIVTARRYNLVDGEWTGKVMMTGDIVQEVGDSLEDSICRAAVAAMETK